MHERYAAAAAVTAAEGAAAAPGAPAAAQAAEDSVPRQSFLARGKSRPPRHTDSHAHAPTKTPPENMIHVPSLSMLHTLASRGVPALNSLGACSSFRASFPPDTPPTCLSACLPSLSPSCGARCPNRIKPNCRGRGGLVCCCWVVGCVVCSDFFFFCSSLFFIKLLDRSLISAQLSDEAVSRNEARS